MMELRDMLLDELVAEAAKTRALLQRAPESQFGWRPHAKSWTLGELSQHIANLPSWVGITFDVNELDLSQPIPKRPLVADSAELLAFFDNTLAEAVARLKAATEADLGDDWSLRMGERIVFTRPKHSVLRNFVLNHVVHHRGQLSVYLRLLDVPIPGMYGQSADEKNP